VTNRLPEKGEKYILSANTGALRRVNDWCSTFNVLASSPISQTLPLLLTRTHSTVQR